MVVAESTRLWCSTCGSVVGACLADETHGAPLGALGFDGRGQVGRRRSHGAVPDHRGAPLVQTADTRAPRMHALACANFGTLLQLVQHSLAS